MKNICIVVQNSYDFDVRVRRKAEALIAAGYSVDVLALRLPEGKKTYVLGGVTVHTLSLGKQRGSLVRYGFEYATFFLWAFLRLSLLMRRRHYAIVDINTLPDFLIFAGILARWQGAKLVLDMHEITPEFYISKYGIAPDSWVLRFLKFQERISFNFADRVITINEPIQELLEQRGLSRSKSTVIMNAADEARFATKTNPAPERGHSPGSEKFVMMYHGTLTKIYGLDIAVEAFGIAHHDMPGAEFWILGSGPEAGRLADQAERLGLSSKVRLFGMVPSNEIPGWLRQCTVGLLPIRRDVFLDFAFPNKLPEFIISEIPVIVSRLKAIHYYFSEEAVAYCEPNSPADLARQMVRVFQDAGLRKRLIKQATKEYAAIRWEIMKARYLNVIEELTGPAARQTPRRRVVGSAVAG
jgi:glycosyltransferase involved in cell wall biosynthesis